VAPRHGNFPAPGPAACSGSAGPGWLMRPFTTRGIAGASHRRDRCRFAGADGPDGPQQYPCRSVCVNRRSALADGHGRTWPHRPRSSPSGPLRPARRKKDGPAALTGTCHRGCDGEDRLASRPGGSCDRLLSERTRAEFSPACQRIASSRRVRAQGVGWCRCCHGGCPPSPEPALRSESRFAQAVRLHGSASRMAPSPLWPARPGRDGETASPRDPASSSVFS
jgi:hypothetical protein